MHMKVVVAGAFAVGALVTALSGGAHAQPVDCEAARCAIQAQIDAECPCAEAKNHGRYTACVARIVNAASREGVIPKKCRNKINGCAIRSTCGKRDGFVSCDFPGDGVSGRCRPLSSSDLCERRGGTVVASCCETCGPQPTATPEEPVATATPVVPVETATPVIPVETATPVEPVPTETPGPGATATETAVPTATPEEPVATATPEEPVPTATEGPIATATEGPVATSTPETPVPTATPEEPVPTATEEPVATATEGPVATATPETPEPTATPVPEPTSTAVALCGNGSVDSGEQCDPPGENGCATFGNGSGNGLETCSVGCTCACPTRVQFTGDASDPASILDTGWTGIAHRAPIISGGTVTVGLENCDSDVRPCGTCDVSGPIVNPGAGAGVLDNQRCSNDSSIKCTDDTPCAAGGGTCEFYFGGPLSLAAGGVSTCVYNVFNGPVTGTANVESGEAVTTALLTSRVFNGIAIDNPCPRCIGDGAFNDGTPGGTCDGGTNVGDPCDANGEVPGRPDFGASSLDCPASPGALIATLAINLSNETNPVVRTLSADSPNCGQSAIGQKCLCQTCNNLAATPCFTNADCTAVGATVCGGNRCIGGTNNGSPCSGASACPSGACGRPGEPTKPSACLETTASPDNNLDCVDRGDGEGECVSGPLTSACSVASGHAQRGCLADSDCGGAPGSCETTNRLCFLTGGGSFQPPQTGLVGTDTLIAVGMEDPPMNDVSNPTLGAVFCVGPTGAGAVNNVAGLPGPGRVTIRGTALGLP